MDMTKFETDLKAQVDAVGAKLTKTIEDWRAADVPERAKLEEKIKNLEAAQAKINETLAHAARMHLPGVEVGKAGEKNKFSYGRLGKLVLGMVSKEDAEYGYEVEVSREMHKRMDSIQHASPELAKAINASTGPQGAFLISTEIQSEMIPELEAASVILSLGAQSRSGLVGNINWNRDQGGMAASYIDTESGGAGTATASTFSQMELAPHVYMALVDVTWKMMNQPAAALEPWIRQRLAYKIGLLKDKTAIRGIGASSQPRGLDLTPGIGTLDFAAGTGGTGAATVYTGASQTITKQLMYMMAKLPERDAALPGAKLGWATSPFVVTGLTMALDADGRHLLWSPSSGNIESSSGRLGSLLGKKIAETSQLAISTADPKVATDTEDLYYGDWNQMIDANWGTLAFSSSDTHNLNFTKALVTIRALGAHDIGVFQPRAFVRGTNFEALTLT